MRVKFTLTPRRGTLFLDYKYNLYLRALIYDMLPSEYAKELHDRGHKYENRSFKLFTFSKIFGRRTKEPPSVKYPLCFHGNIQFYLSSPIISILEYFSLSSIQKNSLRIGNNEVELQSIEVLKQPSIGSTVIAKMLSPMTIRSTLTSANGKKKSYYYNPYEKEFSELMKRNLQKKYFLVNNAKIDGSLKITPLKHCREKIIKGDHDFIIKAWEGIYEIKGSPELIRISYDTGLGEKNSLGFGMWEVINN